VHARWSAILKELGTSRDLLLPGIKESNRARSDGALEAELREMGAQTETITLAEHETPPLSPRAMAPRHIDRLYSGDWQLGDDIHAEAVRRLQTWLDTECGEPDRPISGAAQFKAITAHW
jgi:hypothetical protein